MFVININFVVFGGDLYIGKHGMILEIQVNFIDPVENSYNLYTI